MYKFLAALMLPIGMTLNAGVYAEEDINSYTPLEMIEATIRMTGGHPYGELRPCPECPLRLLPFAPGAFVYINGQRMTADSLQNGQTLKGTVFLQNKPIDSIHEIVAK
ncbi:hypothetical protein [Ectopseudomonas composti]|uniref:hypothetical protein n=1 Tax=Ectopseudomonas composti TaxID=658457 RepID=UPI0007730380|nr:hypothetical protein [Pseudomonas composti]